MKERIEMKNDLRAFNDFDHPNDVRPHAVRVDAGAADTFTLKLPSYSLTVLRFEGK